MTEQHEQVKEKASGHYISPWRLIAAAPDLLEAAKVGLDGLLAVGGATPTDNRVARAVIALRSAIAKAEGNDLHSAAE